MRPIGIPLVLHDPEYAPSTPDGLYVLRRYLGIAPKHRKPS